MSLTLPPLPYALDDLEPTISRRTLALHHGRHHAAYVENDSSARAISATPFPSSRAAISRSTPRPDNA